MYRRTLAAALVAGMLGSSSIVLASDDGSERGRIFSVGGTITPGTTSVVLTELPRGTSFLMTQFCQSQGLFGPVATGSQFGPIPLSDNCTTYTPGVLLEGGQTLSCVSPFGPVFDNVLCMATGFLRR